MPKVKFYAVARGREGPKIYESWVECEENIKRYSGSKYKSFPTREMAQEWIDVELSRFRGPPPPYAEVIDIDSDAEIPPPVTIKSSPSKKQTIKIDFDDDADSDMEIELLPPASTSKAIEPPPPAALINEIKLSPEQQDVLLRVKSGRSVFFTGSAGTGKSVLLREIIKSVRESGKRIAITASTGIASVNIGGCTLHSWAGIGLGQETAKKYAGKFLNTKGSIILRRWRQTDALIIDEVSMLDGKLFDKLEEIGRLVRHNDRPFGGIQLILSGDFCQLPPVPDQVDGKNVPVTFAFDSKSWDKCVGPPVNLTRVFRQKDQTFVDMLNAMRFGELDQETIEKFQSLSRAITYNDGIEPTEIYARRSEVDNANSARLRDLSGPPHTYQARDTPGLDVRGQTISREQMEKLLDRLVCQRQITVKVGAQVMLVKNLEQGQLVNGSVGRVEDFLTYADALAASIEIGTGPGGDQENNTPNTILRGFSASQKWPVVRFTNGRRLLIIPVDFTVENSNSETEAKRDQVPLILAWALSVHKSQGQTLERVKVCLKSTFEKGQAYVALSRATTMDQLQVLSFNPTKVMAHPRVLEWTKGFISHEIPTEMDYDEEDFY